MLQQACGQLAAQGGDARRAAAHAALLGGRPATGRVRSGAGGHGAARAQGRRGGAWGAALLGGRTAAGHVRRGAGGHGAARGKHWAARRARAVQGRRGGVQAAALPGERARHAPRALRSGGPLRDYIEMHKTSYVW